MTRVQIGLVRSATFAAGGPLSVVETARYESLEIDFTRPILIRETTFRMRDVDRSIRESTRTCST